MDDLSLAHSRYNFTRIILYLFLNIVEKRCLEHCVRKWWRFSVKCEECNNHKGSSIARSCTHVCVDSTKGKCIKSNRPKQGEKHIDDIQQASRILREVQQTFLAKGYYCETVGNVNEETVKRYISEQYERDRMEGSSIK